MKMVMSYDKLFSIFVLEIARAIAQDGEKFISHKGAKRLGSVGF